LFESAGDALVFLTGQVTRDSSGDDAPAEASAFLLQLSDAALAPLISGAARQW
jgi:hypothetical protein